mgnify:CR=1 FL=1
MEDPNDCWYKVKREEGKGARIQKGDWVKIKSGRNRPGLSKYMGPFEVERVNEHSIVLANGQIWNKRRVALFMTKQKAIMKGLR